MTELELTTKNLTSICEIVSTEYSRKKKQIHPEELKLDTNRREVVETRQMAATIAKNMMIANECEIALFFGRDRTTMYYGTRQINALCKQYPEYRSMYYAMLKHVCLYVTSGIISYEIKKEVASE